MNKKILQEIIAEISRERFIEIKEIEQLLHKVLVDFIQEKHNIRQINCEILGSGEMKIFIQRFVVEQADENDIYNISFSKAIKIDPLANLGDYVQEQMHLSFEQTDIKKILQNLNENLKFLQKEKEFEFFQSKLNKNIVGLVKKINGNDIIISFPEGEGILKKNKTLPNDIIKTNTNIALYVEDVKKGNNNQVYLSRIHPNFVKELLIQEIPEIAQQLILIKSIARDAGSKTKVAVYTEKQYLNPKKCCIGENGNKIKNIIKEINGEKIDIVIWHENINEFIINAFSPLIVTEIITKKNNEFVVVISEDQFKQAMGRQGQNVKLVKRLCGIKTLKLITEEEKNNKYKQDLENAINSLIEKLEIEEMMAHVLINEGFDSIAKIANAKSSEIEKIYGFNEEIASILIERAQNALKIEKEEFKKHLIENKQDTSLTTIDILSVSQIKTLIENKIFSKTDLSFLDCDELEEIFANSNEEISSEMSMQIISKARNLA